MKKVIGLIVIVLASVIMFQSCDKLTKPPEEGKTDLIDRLKWKFDFEKVMALSLINPVPAIDEDGNIYAIADVKAIPSGTQIVKLSPSGQKIWSKIINDGVASRPMYQNGKLYFILGNSLYCFDAANGDELWSVSDASTYTITALTNEKIYVTRWEDNAFLGASYLDAYDLSGNQVWSQRIKYSEIDSVNFPYTISVRDNQIYLGIMQEIGDANFAIINYQDNGTEVEKKWAWLAPDKYQSGNSYYFRDLAIDDNNNLLFRLTKDGVQSIFSVSADGNINWQTPSSLEKEIVDVSIDKDGNFYTAYDKVEKLSAASTLWTSESKKDWKYEGLASQAPIITQNGSLIYSNFSSILTCVKADGTFDWEQYIYPCDICTEEFHNATVSTNGDVIVISKFGVYCFSGDGSSLAEHGWPKTYANYGNTSSR